MAKLYVTLAIHGGILHDHTVATDEPAYTAAVRAYLEEYDDVAEDSIYSVIVDGTQAEVVDEGPTEDGEVPRCPECESTLYEVDVQQLAGTERLQYRLRHDPLSGYHGRVEGFDVTVESDLAPASEPHIDLIFCPACGLAITSQIGWDYVDEESEDDDHLRLSREPAE